MKSFKPEDYDRALFTELKECGCEFDSIKYTFIDISKKSESVIRFYGLKNKPFTPFQKRLGRVLKNGTNLDIYLKKNDDGLYIIDPNNLSCKADFDSVLKEFGIKVIKIYNKIRYKIDYSSSNNMF